MTFDQLSRQTLATLQPHFSRGEAAAITETAIRHLKNWTRTDYVVNGDKEASPFICSEIQKIVSRLLADEPLQYILGSTYWHGLTLKVTPDVLIPRPETSELVDIICDNESAPDLHVLDLCTGSGCIAIALALNLPFSQVTGVDISDKALAVARENASGCKAKVTFMQADVLSTLQLPQASFNIIVSNPPYICESEKSQMEPNVLLHEPALALFVPDSDPLRFYTPIARNAATLLAPGGKLYLEINPLHADRLSDMIAENGFTDVRILNDIHGRKRFATAVKPS